MDGGTIVVSIVVAIIGMLVTLNIAGKVAKEAAIEGAKAGGEAAKQAAILGAERAAEIGYYSNLAAKNEKVAITLVTLRNEIQLWRKLCEGSISGEIKEISDVNVSKIISLGRTFNEMTVAAIRGSEENRAFIKDMEDFTILLDDEYLKKFNNNDKIRIRPRDYLDKMSRFSSLRNVEDGGGIVIIKKILEELEEDKEMLLKEIGITK
jgi:hypothetical protein